MRKFFTGALAVLVICGVTGAQETLTTTFASNNGQAGNMFDLVAINSVTIDSFDLNVDAGTWDWEIYTLPANTPYFPDAANATAWTMVASGTGLVSNGVNVATPLNLALGIPIAAGDLQAFYVTLTNGTGINYTNGSNLGGVFAEDCNLQFLEGSGKVYPFGNTFSPRIFNGNIDYTVTGGPGYSTGNIAGGELVFNTGVSTLTPTDKQVPIPSVLTLSIESCDQSLVGAPFITVASLVATGSDPTNDLGGEIGIVGLDFSSLITIINGFAPTGLGPQGGANISPAGSQFAISLPCGLPSGMSAYIQSACPDASKPNGLTLSQSIEHEFATSGTLPGPTGDDNFVNISLGCFGTFDFYGVTYGDFYVNSNGNITFGSGDSDWTPSESELLSDQPRIAPFWDDLSPNAGGSVSIGFSPTAFVIDYTSVPHFGQASNTYSASVTLIQSGDVDVNWTELNAPGGTTIVGISPGNGLSGTGDVDFVAATGVSGGPDEALYHIFDGSCTNEAQRLAGGTANFSPSGNAYTYSGTAGSLPDHVANSVTPNSGPDSGGTLVQIDGQFFDSGATYTVEFGAGNFVSTVLVTSECELVCVTPAGAGVVDVIVTNTGTASSSTITGGFTYINPLLNTQSFTVSDDGTANFVMSIAPASFTYYGVTYTDLNVNANGNITFVSGDSDFSQSASEMLSDQPRIAPFWSDLAPSTIVVTETPTDITVDYNADHHGGGGPNIASLVLDKATGNISMNITQGDSFNGVSGSNSALAGISAGGSLGVNAATDLSVTTLATGAMDALFEEFSGGSYDLSGVSVPFTATGGLGNGPYQVN